MNGNDIIPLPMNFRCWRRDTERLLVDVAVRSGWTVMRKKKAAISRSVYYQLSHGPTGRRLTVRLSDHRTESEGAKFVTVNYNRPVGGLSRMFKTIYKAAKTAEATSGSSQ